MRLWQERDERQQEMRGGKERSDGDRIPGNETRDSARGRRSVRAVCREVPAGAARLASARHPLA
jgi:hypothetical protein